MGKKKNNDGFTDNADEPKVSLEDFVLPQLIDAFCATYAPLDLWEPGCEVLTYTQLRNMFKAVPVTIGDPFVLYIQMLELSGFHFKIDIATSEFVIYVKTKI